MSLTAPPTVRDETPTIRGIKLASPRILKWQRTAMVFITGVPLVGLVAALWWGYGRGVSGVDIGLLVGFYIATGLGITVGFHRMLTHQSFKAPAPVRVAFAVLGSLAVQGAAIDWVATHRRHHAYTDVPGDPHSPHVDAGDGLGGLFRGLWYSHVGWMFAPDGTVAEVWAPDLLKDRGVARVSRAFPWLVLVTFLLPALLGGLITTSWSGALSGLLWGGLVRVMLLHHVTWSINSICHVFGTKPFKAHDESRNNPIMALLAFGEGWHNAHHAFPASARHGLRWWEFDASWIVIRTMAAMRLVRDVKLPTPTQLQRRRNPRTART
ncbi:acyl-CoA desaturase [Nitriliruptor alkaliphilus]|uniref:acyl-CoA desaturase n=1 Tax=Nitriliruptor alkaliphilus TaxID=427918 RepID=UPI0006960F30|nr:acyl-CoA desaturase [Nitriliruptor alkaliphilus]